LEEIEKIKFFFWKLFHPLRLTGKVVERTWYFEDRGRFYKVTLRAEDWGKATFYWEVIGPHGIKRLNRDLRDYLIRKAKEDLEGREFPKV